MSVLRFGRVGLVSLIDTFEGNTIVSMWDSGCRSSCLSEVVRSGRCARVFVWLLERLSRKRILVVESTLAELR